MTAQALVDIVGQPGEDRPTLVCIPHAGAGVGRFSRWASVVAPVMNLAIVQLPGREDRCLEEPLATMTEIVDALATELVERHYDDVVVYGHCTGGLVAYELAHRLTTHGDCQPRALAVSSAPPPHAVIVGKHQLPAADLKEFIASFSTSDPSEIPDELWELMEPTVRADLRAAESATYIRSPLQIPIMAIRGSEDHVISRVEAERWAEYTQSTFLLTELPASHFLIDRRPEAVAAALRTLATDSAPLPGAA